jgi:hypothetical protein
MTWLVRIIALGLEVYGLIYVLKLAHQENYRGALTRLVFEVLVVLVFVTCHVVVEMVLRKKKGGWPPWWLR